MSLHKVSAQTCFGGVVVKYKHRSTTLQCDMSFNVFLPPSIANPDELKSVAKIPAVFFLAGLTCSEDTFITKSGATRYASELNIALICPDTSHRENGRPVETESWDFGLGASYYVDATEPEYSHRYRMYTYIAEELYELVNRTFHVDANKLSIAGHSVGGHGALVIALRNPDKFCCVSTFAPMTNPMKCPWGKKAFSRLLGSDETAWAKYDATSLAKTFESKFILNILLDQGSDDKFLTEQLMPEHFVSAIAGNKHVKLNYHVRSGYDHSYFYIATFIEEHLKWHTEYN